VTGLGDNPWIDDGEIAVTDARGVQPANVFGEKLIDFVLLLLSADPLIRPVDAHRIDQALERVPAACLHPQHIAAIALHGHLSRLANPIQSRRDLTSHVGREALESSEGLLCRILLKRRTYAGQRPVGHMAPPTAASIAPIDGGQHAQECIDAVAGIH
jgi:hypothetical protein